MPPKMPTAIKTTNVSRVLMQQSYIIRTEHIRDRQLFQNLRLVARENSNQQAKLHQYRRLASAEKYFWNTGVTITHPAFQT